VGGFQIVRIVSRQAPHEERLVRRSAPRERSNSPATTPRR